MATGQDTGVVISLEGNGARPSHQGGGYSENGSMFTLNTIERHAVCYSIGAMNSEGMMSDNPKAGIHETTVARTIDANGSNPAGYQGGDVVIYDARGNGDGMVSPTITGDHNDRITDYTSVVVIDHSRRHCYQELPIIPTLEAVMGTGGGNIPMLLVKND